MVNNTEILSEEMKVLIIARGYPSRLDPQWGCFEFDQARALDAAGHRVAMMSVDGRFRFYWRKFGITHTRAKGIDLYNIFWFPTAIIRRFNYRFSTYIEKKLALYLYRRIQNEWGTPQIIHAHFLPCIFIGAYLKKKCEIPLVGTEHWSAVNQDVLSSYVKSMGNEAYKGIDYLITVSQSLRQRIQEHFAQDSIVIHNMIGDDFISSRRNLCITQNHDFIFLAVGSLVPVKGHDILISAFEKSGLRESGVRVNIIGDGPNKNQLQKQIDKAGLHDNIILIGRKQKAEIIEELYASDAFVQPSRAENFSVAVLEGLSAGLPVVATLCGGIKECIDERNGILVPIDDIDAMADALSKMYRSISNYNRNAIAEDCRFKYSPSAIVQEITNVYRKLYNGN